MDAFQIVLMIFTLSILLTILVLPYLILHKVARVMIRSFKKTHHAIFH